jgi:hypothetical protein
MRIDVMGAAILWITGNLAVFSNLIGALFGGLVGCIYGGMTMAASSQLGEYFFLSNRIILK